MVPTPAPTATATPALAALAPPAEPRTASPSAPAAQPRGPRFSVQGVDASDVLNVRSGPSPKHEVVGTIPPGARGVAAVGPRRQIGPSVWREVSYEGVRGWVNDRFLVEERAAPRSR